MTCSAHVNFSDPHHEAEGQRASYRRCPKSEDAKCVRPRLSGSIIQGLMVSSPSLWGKGHFKWEEQCEQRPGGLMWLVSLRNSRKASALEQSEWGVSRRGEG